VKIDSHVHITPPDIIANWEKYAEKEPHFSLLSNSKNNKFAAAEDIIVSLDADGLNFDRAVVFGFAFRDDGLCRYVNDYVIEKVKEFPSRLTGFCVVSEGKDAAKEIERCYAAGLKGVGELYPDGQDKPNIAGACAELSIPLLLHANEPVGHPYPGKTDVSLRQLEAIISNNQNVKIILAHWGGGLLFYETMGEIKEKFANVYYDTAATPFLYDERIYAAAKALGLCDKVLFGSDFPLLSRPRYFDTFDKTVLSLEERNAMLGGNARKLLNL
jgi:predicted TIM-barrel fold metal-dependent hydrolase